MDQCVVCIVINKPPCHFFEFLFCYLFILKKSVIFLKKIDILIFDVEYVKNSPHHFVDTYISIKCCLFQPPKLSTEGGDRFLVDERPFLGGSIEENASNVSNAI